MLLRNLAQAAAALLLSTQVPTSYGAVSATRRATICNGHAELCSRSYGNVSFVGAHNSYAVGTDLGANQDQSVTQQLDDGVRLLQVQAHQDPAGVKLCHTNCVIHDGGLAVDFLKTVKSWLDKNPNEVVSILIVNSDNLPPTQWQTVYQNAGMDSISFAPTKSPLTFQEWPTLGEMIDSGKRVVTFLDNQADFTQVPYIIDEFTNVWETPFDVIENSFPCSVNRTNGDPTSQLNLINHYLDRVLNVAGFSIPTPDKGNLTVTNAAEGTGSLGLEVDTCVNVHGRAPNFLLVDFYEFGGGSVFQVAAKINGVQYTPTSIATPVPTTGSDTSVTSTPLNAAPALLLGTMAAWLGATACIFVGALSVL